MVFYAAEKEFIVYVRNNWQKESLLNSIINFINANAI